MASFGAKVRFFYWLDSIACAACRWNQQLKGSAGVLNATSPMMLRFWANQLARPMLKDGRAAGMAA